VGIAGDPGTQPLPGWLHEIAKDGLTTGDLESLETVELQPGYRSDVMIQAPLCTGTYYLIDEKTPAESSLQAVPEPRKILAVIAVLPQRKLMALPKKEQLAFFKPYLSIEDREVAGRPVQQVDFDLHNNLFTINGKEFPGDLRVLQLGKADEWHLSSRLANHPFHIHVNAFEVIEKGADGRERRYWKDTILVKPNRPLLRIRSRYRDFDGKFVLHCHILDHEDRGMMQMVEIRK
jgi:FtsP/CotA-like multicopper oxidase with cupredoxin domain